MNDQQFGKLISDIDWMKKWMEKADKKFARRWVEKFTVGTISTILLAFLGALISLVFIPPTRVAMVFLYNLIA